jgi:CBS domain containing-hemolysin-like protein
MFVVINSFEEYVGILSIEKVLKQLLGHVPGDDFDQYANPVAVAARHTKRPEPESLEPHEEKPDETPVETEEEVVK